MVCDRPVWQGRMERTAIRQTAGRYTVWLSRSRRTTIAAHSQVTEGEPYRNLACDEGESDAGTVVIPCRSDASGPVRRCYGHLQSEKSVQSHGRAVDSNVCFSKNGAIVYRRGSSV